MDNIIKIELLSVNLLFYAKDFSNHIISEMVNKLFCYSNMEMNCSNETALASLAILSQPSSIIEKEIYPFITKNEKPKNIDVELLFSFCVNNDLDKFTGNRFLGNFQGAYSKDDKTAYYNLHHEIHNDRGRYHNKAFDQILKLHQRSQISKEKIDAALASCNRLETMIRFFPYSNMRVNYRKDDYRKIIESILSLEPLLRSHLESISKANIGKYYNQETISPKLFGIQNEIEKTNSLIRDFHNQLFVKIGIQSEEEFPLKNEVEKIIKRHNSDLNTKIGFSDNFEKAVVDVEYERWVPWDRIIERKVAYIMTNARHSEGHYIDSCRNYHKKILPDNIYNMIVSLEYCDDGLKLIFENFSKNSKDHIVNEVLKKTNPEKNHVIELGGKIEYEEEIFKEGLFRIKTLLYLPFP